MLDAGLIIISAFISPFHADRDTVRQIVGKDRFTEIFIDCPLEVCEQRDTKGLYQKARKGLIPDFTGIDSPYEKPQNPDLIIHTNKETIEESLSKIIQYAEAKLQVLSA
jgi:adenylylsulfate kinase